MKEHKEITNPWALCFTGDTKVLLLDGRSLTMKELTDKFGTDKKTYVFSYDLEKNQIVVGTAYNFKKTIKNANIMQITLDNNQKISCTYNHNFLLNDGIYINAQDLKIGDSLMSIYFDRQEEKGLAITRKVINIKKLDTREDVYDFTVDKYHNFALEAGVFVHNSWWMSKRKKGDKWGPGGELSHAPKPHYKEEEKKAGVVPGIPDGTGPYGKKQRLFCKDDVSQIVDKVINDDVIATEFSPITESSKKYFTNDTIKSADGSYITVKTNYDEKDGNVLLEEYTVEKNGKIDTYNNADDFAARLAAEGLF
jgi:hypothetical protein